MRKSLINLISLIGKTMSYKLYSAIEIDSIDF